MTKHVQIPGKSPNIAFHFRFGPHCTEVSVLSVFLPHDAFTTYTYLHCPMRLERLGNIFV
jgi:hypothetical protein